MLRYPIATPILTQLLLINNYFIDTLSVEYRVPTTHETYCNCYHQMSSIITLYSPSSKRSAPGMPVSPCAAQRPADLLRLPNLRAATLTCAAAP